VNAPTTTTVAARSFAFIAFLSSVPCIPPHSP
jgi:hypothetical protein